MKRVTIGDVAIKANVSKATVSHVVNKTRFVEEDTRQRVLQVIDALGYRPSLVARSLTTNRTETIGVIVSDVSNSFFGDLLHGIEDVTRPAGYSLVLCNTDEILEREDNYIDLLLRQRVDGIIAAATSKKWDVLARADVRHTPMVFVDRAFEGLIGPFIGVDNCAGARMGVEHLIACGHREIGILAGFQRLSTMVDRLQGYRKAMEAHGLAVRPEWLVESPLNIEAGREAAMRLLGGGNRPTAVFINNNFLSLGALLAIKALGLRCPEDIAMVGFDDHPWAAVSCPPLTVVRQPAREIGQTAALLLREMIDEKPVDLKTYQLDCALVLRQSCCLNHAS
jgi:LacI family transcriptional regulator